jgi:hypothetical protein
MKKTALSGAVVAFVLAAVPMATSASAAQTEATSASVATVSSSCHVTHYYNGRYHRRGHIVCTHRSFGGNRGDHDGRFGNGNGNGRGNGMGDGHDGHLGNGDGRGFPRG